MFLCEFLWFGIYYLGYRCKECNIVFCRHENFVAHKKHYCQARENTPCSPPPPGTPSPPLVQLICAACGIKFASMDNLVTHQAFYCPKRPEPQEHHTRCPKCKVCNPWNLKLRWEFKNDLKNLTFEFRITDDDWSGRVTHMCNRSHRWMEMSRLWCRQSYRRSGATSHGRSSGCQSISLHYLSIQGQHSAGHEDAYKNAFWKTRIGSAGKPRFDDIYESCR